MENVYVFGISWRHASSERIEAYTIPSAEQPHRIKALQQALDLPGLCYLATCNRVELSCVLGPEHRVDEIREGIYRELNAGSDPSAARQELRIWGGEGAAEHLFLLAAGLDSAQLGEQEIAGQLRRAIDQAREAGCLGPQLMWLFEQVLKVGKRVQTESGLRRGRISLAEIAVDAAREALAVQTGPVALVGVSKMTERCAESLAAQSAELIFVNRTLNSAAILAERFGGSVLSLDELLQNPPTLRAMISATSAPQALFGESFLTTLGQQDEPKPLLIDLAIPPDIDSAAAKQHGLERIDMDQINALAAANSAKRHAEQASARQLVDEALERLRSKVAGRSLSPLIGELYNVYQETAFRALERELGKRLIDLSPEQKAAVLTFAEQLAGRLAHIPAVGLRALAAQSGIEPVRTFLSASNDPMTRRLVELARDSSCLLPDESGQ